MNLLECLVGIALCVLLLNPLLKTSSDLLAKQIAYEKSHFLGAEADRALELIGRAIRMAGYKSYQHHHSTLKKNKIYSAIEIEKHGGFEGSDSITIRHELSDGVDFDCIGNALTKERTKNHLAMQAFFVNRQADFRKVTGVYGGSLICQSLDRQGRKQNTTLMNGVHRLTIEELNPTNVQEQKAFRVRLEMADGGARMKSFERTFSTRNLP